MASRWPNFFIVGAPKAGTTSLYEYLKESSEVFMPENKEPHFFAPKISQLINYPNIKTKEDYLALFSGIKNEKAVGEASVHYLQDIEAPSNIQKIIPNARIIIMLRDPVERAFSHYLMSVRFGETTDSFNKILTKILNEKKDLKSRFYYILIDASLYYHQVKRYFEQFQKEQIKVIIFEDFVKEVRNSVKDVMKFLNLDSDLPENIGKKYNEFTEPRNRLALSIIANPTLKKIAKHTLPKSTWDPIREKVFIKKGEKPEISLEDREILINFFADDVKMLEKFIEKKLSWKNFS